MPDLKPNWFYPLFATCAVCGERLQFDIDPNGTPGRNGDWGASGDYGCETGDDDGSDAHTPIDLEWKPEEMPELPADNTDSVNLPPDCPNCGSTQSWAEKGAERRLCRSCGHYWDTVEPDSAPADPGHAPWLAGMLGIGTKTWTYSQVNPGGADVTHGLTFTGTDAEWAEHLTKSVHEGIEIFNAKPGNHP